MHLSLRSLVASLPLGISLLRFFGAEDTSQLPLEDIAVIQQPKIPGRNGTQVYGLELGTGIAAPDGFPRKVVTVNGKFGAPLLTAWKGDRILASVHNSIYDNEIFQSTSVHWHGMFQHRSNAEDGVGWVTQCPIIPGLGFNYDYSTAGQTGTYWYHSHVSTQYCDGLRGALVIYDRNDPMKYLYDFDDENTVITLEDWHHVPALADFDGTTISPTPDAVLINGKGRYANLVDPSYPRSVKLSVIKVRRGYTYRFRLINYSCLLSYNVTIDRHKFYVIEADGVTHKPLLVDSLEIFIGQRYSIVVKADQPIDNYWFRAVPSKNLTNQALSTDAGLNNAIFRYIGAPDLEPKTTPNISRKPLNESRLIPFYNPGAQYCKNVRPENNITLDIDLNKDQFGVYHWTINNASFTPPPLPVLLQILSGARQPFDFLPNGSVYSLPQNTAIRINIPDTHGIFDAHPFHLHGHNFDIIRSAGQYVENYVNPPRRDVVAVSDGGPLGQDGPSGVSFCFQTNNPGPWILHCHIDWHLNQGLAVVMAEAPAAVVSGPNSVHVPPDLDDLCVAFNASGLPPI
ncbi:laccase [Sistotremastrum niveocremeum HHB9708]|uniref:Laccase n=1 Tax=Sistotremastrum niveocremeum HHB9708 TaxID=1314777 RepID=A0A164S227_9AGAM|nr:laccase [Sistotremastrum niveocremeum HHB9708]